MSQPFSLGVIAIELYLLYNQQPTNQMIAEKISIEAAYDILSRFDFNRVHAAMTIMEHKWIHGGEDGDYGVPSVEKIKAVAENLLIKTVSEWDPKKPYSSMGTGGLRVYAFDYGMELVFTLERRGTF